MPEILLSPQTYISLLTLSFLEVVLGIDNIIFIAILAGKLPVEKRQKARVYGLLVAVIGRLVLLSTIVWLTGLTKPLFSLFEIGFSVRDLILLAGGLFLIGKSAHEIYEATEVPAHDRAMGQTIGQIKFSTIVWQIVLIDMVFSLDSIITAVGLARQIPVMVAAILIALGVMIWASQPISEFIDHHPSVKMLALSFLLMIGTLLTAEAFHIHVPKGYVYFSLAFSLFVEFLNIRARKHRKA